MPSSVAIPAGGRGPPPVSPTLDAERPIAEDSEGLRLLLIALAGVVLYHGGLLPFTHGNTYDAYIHMFFADSYRQSWFDVWEPRWYTGFATTSYPPGTHMTIAAFMTALPVRAAFVVVQLLGLLLLAVGVYRFALLWVRPRAAGYAAIAMVLSSSISETVHLFGQLPTIFSLGIFLNGLPYIYRWIVFGSWKSFAAAVIFSAATTAAHHVTTIFGGVLFVLPLGLHALHATADISKIRGNKQVRRAIVTALGRGALLAGFMVAAMAVTVWAYWVWSIMDPITQVPIPHGSRENFLTRRDLGFIFFLLPWGTALIFLPYVVYATLTTRLWPLGISVLLSFVLGTGGTTPISRALLGGAFDILTLDRFTFWATILILPFLGFMTDGLINGRSGEAVRAAFGRGTQRVLIGGYFVSMTLVSVFAAILPTIQPTQPKFIDPIPIVRFLGEDDHDRWRYLTLGFGDQFAYLSSLSAAQSIDGNYHSARRLPDLTRFSVERLENAKYLGVPGLGSLNQFLVNADAYHLKYVFSNDAFYDPLLFFTGWTRLNRLSNGVSIWEKPDVTPLPTILPRRHTPPLHATMWGVIPAAALVLAMLIFLEGLLRRNFGTDSREMRPLVSRAASFSNPHRIRSLVIGLAVLTSICGSVLSYYVWDIARAPKAPREVIFAYYDDLDFRRFASAYHRLDPKTRPDFDTVMFNWRWRGGLLASYGKISDLRVMPVSHGANIRDWNVQIKWLTALNVQTEELSVRTIKRDGRWFVAPISLRPVQTPHRLQRGQKVTWNVTGRRQPRAETDLHRDRLDRPRLNVWGLQIVKRKDRYFSVGGVTNSDADPAMVSLFAELIGDGRILVRQAAGQTFGQRLLPAESSGFRVDFEGVLSLEDDAARGGFDPKLFVPPELAKLPDQGRVLARAQVTGRDLYRDIGLNAVRVDIVEGQPEISGLAVNLGTETASIIRIVILLLDDQRRPIWTEAIYVENNIYPGQSSAFKARLPAASTIDHIATIQNENVILNGSNPMFDRIGNVAQPVLLPLIGIEGYSAMHLHVSALTHDPQF